MKLTAEELAYVRSLGLYISEKCDGCGKLLNQSVRYTITGKPEVWCSADCQDKAMGWGKVGNRKKAGPGFRIKVCQNCENRFKAKHGDAQYCSERCKKSSQRKRKNGVVPQTVQPPLAEAHG